MKVNILFQTTGLSQYDLITVFTEAMADALIKMGHCAVVIGGKQTLYRSILDILNEKEWDAFVSFNGVGCDEVYDGLLSVKKRIEFYIDHPVWHKSRIFVDKQQHNIACVDRNHVELIRDLCIKTEKQGLYFFPHGGMQGTETKGWQDRQYDISLFGSCLSREEALEQLKQLDPDMQNAAAWLIDYLTAHPQASLEEATGELLNLLGGSQDMIISLLEQFIWVDQIIRGYFREKIVNTVATSGYKIHIFGNGWENSSCIKNENVILHESVSYMEHLNIMGDTKIVLNVMPWFKDGFHERIPCAMLNGAVCLTDSSTYIEEQFTDGKDIVLYSLEHLGELPGKIQNILENPEQSVQIAKNGYENADKNHRWSNRAKLLVDMINDRADNVLRDR